MIKKNKNKKTIIPFNIRAGERVKINLQPEKMQKNRTGQNAVPILIEFFLLYLRYKCVLSGSSRFMSSSTSRQTLGHGCRTSGYKARYDEFISCLRYSIVILLRQPYTYESVSQYTLGFFYL